MSTITEQSRASRPSPLASGLPPLIGFCGSAGAGKSSAAMHVVATFEGYHRISFADPLRAMLRGLGLPADALAKAKEVPHPLLCGKTPRFALQTLGTEWGRQLIGPDLWCRAAIQRAQEIMAGGARVVFDDVRFENEAKAIRDLGGIIIHLSRPGFRFSTSYSTHASEAGIPQELIDHSLCADGIVDLNRQLNGLLNSLAA